MRILPPLALTLTLAACVSAPVPRAPVPRPIAVPLPRPTPVVVVPTGTDWRDWPVTPGTWRYGPGVAGTSVATFGAASQGFVLQLTCDPRTRRVVMSIPAAPGSAPLTVRTTSTSRTLPAATVAYADAWPPIRAEATLAATDPLLDAMAFSRGRFVVEQAGAATLVIPAWAEIPRVIEDCR